MKPQESIFADINCKGGIALLVGIIVKETEKAVQIHYALEPIFAGSSSSQVTIANRQAWVPKSQVESDGRGAVNIALSIVKAFGGNPVNDEMIFCPLHTVHTGCNVPCVPYCSRPVPLQCGQF